MPTNAFFSQALVHRPGQGSVYRPSLCMPLHRVTFQTVPILADATFTLLALTIGLTLHSQPLGTRGMGWLPVPWTLLAVDVGMQLEPWVQLWQHL